MWGFIGVHTLWERQRNKRRRRLDQARQTEREEKGDRRTQEVRHAQTPLDMPPSPGLHGGMLGPFPLTGLQVALW